MRHQIECPGRKAPAVFDERQAIDWLCQHQLQLGLQTVAETIEKPTALQRFTDAMCAAACLRRMA
jgi:hypothetical protein